MGWVSCQRISNVMERTMLLSGCDPSLPVWQTCLNAEHEPKWRASCGSIFSHTKRAPHTRALNASRSCHTPDLAQMISTKFQPGCWRPDTFSVKLSCGKRYSSWLGAHGSHSLRLFCPVGASHAMPCPSPERNGSDTRRPTPLCA